MIPEPSFPRRQSLPRRVQRRGSALLNQQCWLWGQDVKRAEGNLLLAHGFERLRAPAGQSGSSQYSLLLPGNLNVRLWGFGLYFGAETGMFINRFEFVPREARMTPLWQANEMAQLPRVKDFSLLAQALRWIGTYERWVLHTFGLEYRKACLSQWESRVCRIERISEAWNELALSIETPLSPALQAHAVPCCQSPQISFRQEQLTYTPRKHRKRKIHDRSHGSRAAASV